MTQNKIRVGITHGDINGIGYEVIIKALSDSRMLEFCTPVIYGSPKVAAYHKKVLNMDAFNFYQVRSAIEAENNKVNIINCCDDNIRVELGKKSSEAGEAAFSALEQAVNDLKIEAIDVLVTAPVDKDNIQSENFKFPGHTEYLAQHFDSKNELMLLVSEDLRVGVVTGHVPLKDVPSLITKELLMSKLKTLHKTLVSDFACTNPRIAVLGLNPHSGDNGVIGTEELDVIIPTIKEANDKKITVLGPYAADGFFGSGQYRNFDAILAMYHDQGLAPFKALTFDKGVNFTAGIPIVRTSPGHGTAYNIVGEDKASADSFIAAIYQAIDIYRNRAIYKEASKSPLPKYEIKANGESDHVDLTKIEESSDF